MNASEAETTGTFPQLDATEARILGSLVEKEATTPENYPLTANAVQLACNQKNGRDPEMALDAGTVGHTLRTLENRRLVKAVHGARAQRYEHRFAEAYSLTRAQQAVLAVLLLRGAQTVAELQTRGERLAPIADIEETRGVLERLQQRGLVANLGHAAGQREDRWMHQLGGPVSAADLPAPRAAAAATSRDRGHGEPETAAHEARIDALEARVAALEGELAALRERLGDAG